MQIPEGMGPGPTVRPNDLPLPGDVHIGEGRYRGGLKVMTRTLHFENRFGMAAYRDVVEHPDGAPGNQDFVVFDQGAVLVYPTLHKPGRPAREATVVLGTGMNNYGSGEVGAMEALGARIRTEGHEDRTGEELAEELVRGRGLHVAEITPMAELVDLTGRVYNPTQHIFAELTDLPDEDALDRNRLRAIKLGEFHDLIRTRKLVNSTVIAGLTLVQGFVDSSSPHVDTSSAH